MQEDTNTNSQSNTPVSHQYVEVENDLLSKPNALANILLVEQVPATIVFCNSPSEADLVVVMLKKKNISSEKMIGHVPFQRAHELASALRSGEISVLVVTDISARDLDLNCAEMIVNYAIHEDPEIYLHRTADHETLERLKKVVSLVSPLDFGNFHFLKKVVDFELTQIALPDAATIAKLSSQTLLTELSKKGSSIEDENIKEMLNEILSSENKDDILKALVHIAIVELPALKEAGSDRRGRGRRGDNENRGRDNRRNDRNDRRRGRDDYEGGDDSDRREDRDDSPRRERPEFVPQKKDIRYYIGLGSSANFSEEEFVKILSEQCGGSSDLVKRFSLRGDYSFVDIPEDGTEELRDKITGLCREDGSEILSYRATTISIPREKVSGEDSDSSEEEGSDEETASAADSEESNGSEAVM